MNKAAIIGTEKFPLYLSASEQSIRSSFFQGVFMFEKLIFIAAAAILIPLYVSANPVSPYAYPVISEVQWIDSLKWSIELSNVVWSSVKRACTTDVVKLYIASSKKTYSTRIYFNDAGLGVLTRSSITAIPEIEKVMIMRIDTIFIPDHEVANPQYPNDGWKCAIKNLKSGYSLIGFQGPKYIESSRSSIGAVGNYTTIHHLCIIDRGGNPLPRINAYDRTVSSDGAQYPVYIKYSCKGATDTNGLIALSTAIGSSWDTYLSDSILRTYATSYINFYFDTIPYRYYPVCPTWRCNYIDTSFECNDTFMVKPNYQKITIVDNEGTPYQEITPKLYGGPFGAASGPGTFLFRFFPRSSGFPIEFYRNTDNALVAACTCSYVDTGDTLFKTLIATSTVTIRAPKEALSGSTAGPAFSILVSAPGDVSFIFTTYGSVDHASIGVYSIDGRKAMAINAYSRAPGTHTVHWNGCNASGKKLAPGNYICKMFFGGRVVASKRVSIF